MGALFAGWRGLVAGLGRRLGLAVAGVVVLAVALGFLTAALWAALSAVLTPAQIALLFGLAYGGAGLVLIALARHRPDPPPPKAGPEPAAPAGEGGLDAALGQMIAAKGTLPTLLGGFLLGLDLAARLRRPPR